MTWLEYHKEPVTLHSGGRSHWLIDAAQMFNDVHIREAVLDYWEVFVRFRAEPYEFVGIPTGGLAWADAIAERVGGVCCHPLQPIYQPGTRFVVDDVLTTGRSILENQYHMALVVVDRGQREHYVREVVAWSTMHLPLAPRAKEERT